MPVKRNLSNDGDLSSIAGRLRTLRAERKVTQATVASAVGVHPVQLSEWESGKWVPRPAALAKLADYYGVSTDWIVVGGLQGIIKRTLVPRGTASTIAGEAGDRSAAAAKRLLRADAFEREMIRLGATDEDADYIRIRTRSYMETVLSSGGTQLELSEEQLDIEFDAYLENLRAQIDRRIKDRKKSSRSVPIEREDDERDVTPGRRPPTGRAAGARPRDK